MCLLIILLKVLCTFVFSFQVEVLLSGFLLRLVYWRLTPSTFDCLRKPLFFQVCWTEYSCLTVFNFQCFEYFVPLLACKFSAKKSPDDGIMVFPLNFTIFSPSGCLQKSLSSFDLPAAWLFGVYFYFVFLAGETGKGP